MTCHARRSFDAYSARMEAEDAADLAAEQAEINAAEEAAYRAGERAQADADAEADAAVAYTTRDYDDAHRARAALGTAGIPARLSSGMDADYRIVWAVRTRPADALAAAGALSAPAVMLVTYSPDASPAPNRQAA